jgi:hypothetical protein
LEVRKRRFPEAQRLPGGGLFEAVNRTFRPDVIDAKMAAHHGRLILSAKWHF